MRGMKIPEKIYRIGLVLAGEALLFAAVVLKFLRHRFGDKLEDV